MRARARARAVAGLLAATLAALVVVAATGADQARAEAAGVAAGAAPAGSHDATAPVESGDATAAVESRDGVPAESLDGAAILERARAAVEAGGSRSAEFTLEVRTPAWSATRTGRIYKQIGREGRNTLIVLDGPEQVRGIKVLSRQPPAGRTQQWLYVPSTHRARRVAVGESGRSIFGSDFSASDLEQRRAGLRSTLQRRETRGGDDAYVVEITGSEDGVPVDEMLWIRASDFRLARREFYVDGTLDRVYRVDELREIEGIPTPVSMTLVNLAGGSRSHIQLQHMQYRAALDATLFAAQHLDSRITAADDGPDTADDGPGAAPPLDVDDP